MIKYHKIIIKEGFFPVNLPNGKDDFSVYMIQNEWFSCSVSEDGQHFSISNQKTGRVCCTMEELFSLHCQMEDGREIMLHAKSQNSPKFLLTNQVMTIFYPHLITEEEDWNIHLMFTFALEKDQMRLGIEIENSDNCRIYAIQCLTFSVDFRNAPIRKGEYRRLPPHYFSVQAATSPV